MALDETGLLVKLEANVAKWEKDVDFHPELTRVFHRELTHLEIMLGGS